MGAASSFVSPITTCVDAAHLAVDPSVGIEHLAGSAPASSVGTWAPGVDVPCKTPGASGRSCIAGGFDILGDTTGVGLMRPPSDPVPYRPVLVSPFALDTLEFTVGRFRQLVLTGKYKGDMPIAQSEVDSCTWLGPNDASNDAFPLNCVDYPSALSLCRISGGTLPTEAQWNHAARGRGQRRLFPWGNSDPMCCTESMERTASEPPACGMGPEPAGSHPRTKECGGVGDVTRDGVVDMGGSLTEAVLDDFEPYAGPWSSRNVLRDPPNAVIPMPSVRRRRGGLAGRSGTDPPTPSRRSRWTPTK